jgi:signal transduction histidine kinase
MIKSLYSKLAAVLLIAFCVIAMITIRTLDTMIASENLVSDLSKLVLAAFAFALVTGLLVFAVLTRRLRHLAHAVENFRDTNFSRSVAVPSFDPEGDEIERLGFAIEQMQLVEQVHRLENTDLQRRELLANVSHDLRTPLASMRGYLETLLLKQGQLSLEEQRNYLEVAAKQSERLGKLINNLFELTKLDANEVRPNLEVFPITELVQDVAQKFELAAQQNNVRIETNFEGSLAPVHADIALIERVLENLIENALRHCTSGARIRISLEPLTGRVAVSVADTGSGIAADELPNIFKRFYQSDRNYGSAGGAGLGLTITKRILDLHGSPIDVESEIGRGTTFRFELPVAA